ALPPERRQGGHRMKQSLRLKAVLAEASIQQDKLARAVGISRPALNGLLNHGQWPRKVDRAALKKKITAYVKSHGGEADGLFDVEKAPPRRHAAKQVSPPIPNSTDEEMSMLLRKQTLTPDTRRHFHLPRDPFADPSSHEDV